MRSACPTGKHGIEVHMAYFKEKSMLAMAMKASASSTVLAALWWQHCLPHHQHRGMQHAGLHGRQCHEQAAGFQLLCICSRVCYSSSRRCSCAITHGTREGTPFSKCCHAQQRVPHSRHRAARHALMACTGVCLRCHAQLRLLCSRALSAPAWPLVAQQATLSRGEQAPGPVLWHCCRVAAKRP